MTSHTTVRTVDPSLPAHRRHALARLRAGHDLLRRERWQEAERELGAGIDQLGGDEADWRALALARLKLDLPDAALETARRAVELDPQSVEARKLLARSLIHLHRHAEAVTVYQAIPGGVPAQHDTLINYGTALLNSGQAEASIAPLMQALTLQIDSVPGYLRLGAALKELRLYEQAVECFRTAVALEPDNLAGHGYLVHLCQFACRWASFEADVQAMLAALARVHVSGRTAPESTPFAMVAIPHRPTQMRQAAELEARRLGRGIRPLPPRRASRREGGKLRIAYLSCDFFRHATAMLVSEVLELHDRERFELHLYDHSRDDGSPERERLRRCADRWTEVQALTPQRIAERIRADEVDILVDLKGYTQGHRLQTLAWRPAPVQMSWLGFPGTTGASFIDYFIGDPWVTPLSVAPAFSEKIAQMPHCYQPNDRLRARPSPRVDGARARWGLPEDRPVLACFNHVYKIVPETWDCWMRILRAAPAAVLWLLGSNDQAQANLRREAQARGVDPQRIHFAAPVLHAEHQARLPLADLMLDTWPCNAHTTASDALWAGLPIVTLSGEVFTSRVAGSLLKAVGLGELVCTDIPSYEATALALLADPPRLAGLRRQLEAARDTAPLFDSGRFARDLEDLYRRAWDRHLRRLAPDHLPAR